jgi:hypothetical protein
VSAPAPIKPTKPQLDHLRAAAAGQLFVNDHGGPVRVAVRLGGKVNQAVCERLRAAGLIEPVEIPGRRVCFRYDPTDAGRAMIRGAT